MSNNFGIGLNFDKNLNMNNKAGNVIDSFNNDSLSIFSAGGVAQTDSLFKFEKTQDNLVKFDTKYQSPAFSINSDDKKVRKSKIISELPDMLKAEEPSEKTKKEIVRYIKSIDSENFRSVMRGTETKLGVNPLILQIQNSPQLNDVEKVDAMKYLLAQGKVYAQKEGSHTDDFIKDLENNIANYNSETSKVEASKITADFRKLVDRKAPDKKDPKVNGEVDRATKQGDAGDCWLLSGITAFNNTKAGKEIINKALSVDEKTGDVTVTLRGLPKPIVVTKDELKYSNNFSSGDGDVRAIEIAVDKYFRENGMRGKTDTYGNTSHLSLILLGGYEKPVNFVVNQDEIKQTIEGFKKNGKENVVAITAVLGKRDMSGATVNMLGGTKLTLSSAHAYTIDSVDSNNVVLIDPNSSNERIRVPKSMYYAYFNNISYVEINGEETK